MSLSESPACRILVISSSVKQAVAFIHTIQGTATDDASPEFDLDHDLSSATIPWSIANKYYTANVHFEAHEISHWSAQRHAPAVPAIIYVWAPDEPYKNNIQLLSRDLAGYDPEVSLAVRIPSSLPQKDTAEDEVEDDSIMDEFLSSHGFEFVNASPSHSIDNQDRRDNLSPDDDDDISHSDGIPRLPRVIDALQTIMWPSMQTHDRPTRKQAQIPNAHHISELLSWAQDTFDTPSMRENSDSKKTTEMDDLERWLSDGVVPGDPWKDAAGIMTTSPIAIDDRDGPPSHLFGFDDDFTAFVSVPAVEGEKGDLSSSDMSFEGDQSMLSAGIDEHYASLGSASDFGSEDGDSSAQYVPMKDDDEDELPTEEEIRATSVRIFGVPPPLSIIESAPAKVVDEHTPTPGKTDFDDLPPTLSSALSGPQDEDEHDLAPFDLSRVLSALEDMKAEIAGMEDEGERRKAAARVALGLVHGLEAEH